MTKLKWFILFILVFFVGAFSLAEDKPEPKTLDEWTFDTTFYSSDQVDTLVEGGGGGTSTNGNITIIGAIGPEDEDIEHKNISRLKFDKSSGFTVNDTSISNEVEISLGSSWTELIPDFTNSTLPNLKPSGEEKLSIKAIPASKTGTYWDYSNTNKNEKTFFIGINANGELSSDITVSAPIGKYTNNQVIAAGTEIDDVLRNMLVKKQNPINPTLSIYLEPDPRASGLVEYKTKLLNATKVRFNWTKNSAGNYTNVIYKLDNVIKFEGNSVSPYINYVAEDINALLASRTTSFPLSITIQYADGPDIDGSNIPAGQLTSSLTMTPARYVYYNVSEHRYDIESPGEVIAMGTTSSGHKRLATTETRGSRNFQIQCPVGTIQIAIAFPLFFVPKPENGLPTSKVLFKSVSMPIESDVTDQLLYNEVSSVPVEAISETAEDIPMNRYGVCILRSTEAFTGAAIVTVYY